MIMNWSFTKFTKSLMRFAIRYFTWVKSFRIFNNFQYTKPVGNGFFSNYVFHQKVGQNFIGKIVLLFFLKQLPQ